MTLKRGSTLAIVRHCFFRPSKPPITTLPCRLFSYISTLAPAHRAVFFSCSTWWCFVFLPHHCWLPVKGNGDKKRGLVCSRIHIELSQWSSGKMVECLPHWQLAGLNCFNWALPTSAGVQIGWGLSGVRMWILKSENVNYEKRECELWKARMWNQRSQLLASTPLWLPLASVRAHWVHINYYSTKLIGPCPFSTGVQNNQK